MNFIRADIDVDCFSESMSYSHMISLTDVGHPCTELNIQRRMVEPVANMVSKHFYHGKLRTAVDMAQRPNVPKAQAAISRFTGGQTRDLFVWIDYKNSRCDTVGPTQSKVNDMELAACLGLVNEFLQSGIDPKDITLLSPYAAQVSNFRTAVGRGSIPQRAVKMNTVDGYQGDENSVVVVSLTTRENIGFNKEKKRNCVALSRGRDAVVLLCDYSCLDDNTRDKRYIRKLKDIRADCIKKGSYVEMDANTTQFNLPANWDLEVETRQAAGGNEEEDTPAQLAATETGDSKSSTHRLGRLVGWIC